MTVITAIEIHSPGCIGSGNGGGFVTRPTNLLGPLPCLGSK